MSCTFEYFCMLQPKYLTFPSGASGVAPGGHLQDKQVQAERGGKEGSTEMLSSEARLSIPEGWS